MAEISSQENKNVTTRFRINKEDFDGMSNYVNVHENELRTLSNLSRVAIFEYMENHK